MRAKVGQWWWNERINMYYYVRSLEGDRVHYCYFEELELREGIYSEGAFSSEPTVQFLRRMACLLFDDVEPPVEDRRPRKESLLCRHMT